jgi:hypothetical protein
LCEIRERSITYCSKVGLTSQKEWGAKEGVQNKMLLQNAFIRIQFLEKFKYFCPYLK